MDKAENVAARIRRQNEVEGHHVLARIAENGRDVEIAEREYRTAMQLAPRDSGRVIDLAAFLATQGHYQGSENTVCESVTGCESGSFGLFCIRRASRCIFK